MRLAGLVSEGSGTHNEDAAGFIERDGEVAAAWILDGVTGINGRTYLPCASDAAWLVERTVHHLRQLAAADTPLPALLENLVAGLMGDWQAATRSISLPDGYDMPATCLLLAKRYTDGWKVLRLGDSLLLVDDGEPRRINGPETELAHLEAMLRDRAQRLRIEGPVGFAKLLVEFQPQLMESRRNRNTHGNHSILVPDVSALTQPEFVTLENPASILLCSDGFYRAVDTYGLVDDAGLLASCSRVNGVQQMLADIRSVEALDKDCRRHPRFKPADDASAICLVA